jgi:hypothetical protein
MKRFKLSEAANAILEGSKETLDANVAAKRGARGSDQHPSGEVGSNRTQAQVAYGEKDAGIVGYSPNSMDDELPDYLKGTPQATPPGATPPVGAEKAGVGAATPQNQPQQTMGRKDVMHPAQSTEDQYSAIRDRIMGKAPTQTMQKNPGATFQSYAEGLDMSEDVRALLEGEGLSEEFASKATTIFEAAVMSRIEIISEQVERELTEQFEVAVEQIKEDLASKVDDYLNYMVEEWMKENALAVETGLRAEIAEDFIGGLRNLFVEHWIDIPEDKINVVEEMAEKVAELEAALNEEISRGIELSKEINEQKKIEAIYTACEGLPQTQVEKLKSLAESVEFTTEEEFSNKLSTLIESYFRVGVKVAEQSALDEVLIEEEKKVTKSSDPLMEQYASLISKTLVK